MKKFSALLAAVAIAATASPAAHAKLNKPINASMVGRSMGCIVADARGIESFDPECQTFSSVKLNAAGGIQHYIYHDEARLRQGQVIPNQAVTYPVNYVVFGLACSGTVRITPSGIYSSNQVCTPI